MSMRSFFDEVVPAELNSSSSLWEKYRPQKIIDFIGLERPKRVLQHYVANPYDKAWLFVGPSGTGKTAMALALAGELEAEIHTLSAPDCSRDKLDQLCDKCLGFRKAEFKRHFVLINEAEVLSRRCQTDLRSRLEGPSRLQNVVWVFTATSLEDLDPGFTSRCMNIKFSSHGISKDAARLLERIWDLEVPDADKPRPNFARLIKDAKNDVRTALNQLESKIADQHT